MADLQFGRRRSAISSFTVDARSGGRAVVHIVDGEMLFLSQWSTSYNIRGKDSGHLSSTQCEASGAFRTSRDVVDSSGFLCRLILLPVLIVLKVLPLSLLFVRPVVYSVSP